MTTLPRPESTDECYLAEILATLLRIEQKLAVPATQSPPARRRNA